MKAKSITFLVLTLILVLAITFVSLFGINLFGVEYYKGILHQTDGNFDGINQGIDLAGGSTITFEADNANVTQAEMEAVQTVFQTRLTGLGYTEARISRDSSDMRKITVEIPNVTDTQQAIELLGSTAELTFRDADGNILLTGADVKGAEYKYGRVTENGAMEHYTSISFTEEGQQKFADATAKAAALTDNKNVIIIMMDNIQVMSASVKEKIDSDSCIIHGSMDQASATMLANQIKSGQLPVKVNVAAQSTVGAELGETALSSSLWAALIGLLLIMLFMMCIYRLPGLVASIALIGYTGVMCLIIGVFRINLSLSGIAGIVLSIGMAVDANVIIFERLKEELNAGKTVRAAVDAGFHRALSAIIDANVTTIIATIVLWLSNVATVQGFAITLFIGVVLSMLTAITLTRFLLKQIVGLNVKNPVLYGISSKKKEVEQNV